MKRVKSKITYETIIELCKIKNWTCLDNEYVNANKTMNWECNECNFVWSSNYNNTRKRNCSRCTKGSSKYSLDEVKKIADNKGFILLDNEYKRSDVQMNWKCKDCDYEWKTSFSNINREKTKNCPKCNNHISKYTFEEVKNIVAQKNLECLSNHYQTSNHTMEWKCLKCNRIWNTSFRSILQSVGGCIKCTFDKTMKLSLDYVKEHIKDKSFICLSQKYINVSEKMLWKCNICSNEWNAHFHHIKDSNSGCPNCVSFKSEKLCRIYFEDYIGYKFPKRKLKCLEGLELDGYCEEINLAFEYHGLQHYKYVHHFHRNGIEDFHKQQQRDLKKIELCKKYNIDLIIISCDYDHKNEEKLKKYIFEKLLETKHLVIV
jgi:DNA-directed RNA polymerase subunit RPC12/RpoP